MTRSRARKLDLAVAPFRKVTLRLVRDDPATAAALPTLEHRNIVLRMSRSIVFISSPLPEGESFIPCTGIVISWDGATKCARVLTSYVYERHELQPKLCVQLPDKSIVEGRLAFVNPHYSIAILEIVSDLPLQVPTFQYGAKYAQEILALSRDKNMCLVARRGTILWGGKGGLVVDNGGSPVGMVYDEGPFAPIISMSTALSCIGMWEQFRCVARPVFKMDLTTVQLLSVSMREELSIKHNINDGFIVKDVDEDSDLERLGVRIGDMIFFQDECGSTLPQIDDYLLSLGWKYLRGMKSMVLKLEVHDIAGPVRETITLPLEFFCRICRGA
uniref:PDZ domain-containing protein n=1 Tax=Leersia perrieri TaxID=77586 RepID=A0A0D9WE68_9ORYZ